MSVVELGYPVGETAVHMIPAIDLERHETHVASALCRCVPKVVPCGVGTVVVHQQVSP